MKDIIFGYLEFALKSMSIVAVAFAAFSLAMKYPWVGAFAAAMIASWLWMDVSLKVFRFCAALWIVWKSRRMP
jgi:uncharacterized membrane protein YesL